LGAAAAGSAVPLTLLAAPEIRLLADVNKFAMNFNPPKSIYGALK
jgi:hypothetical protein